MPRLMDIRALGPTLGLTRISVRIYANAVDPSMMLPVIEYRLGALLCVEALEIEDLSESEWRYIVQLERSVKRRVD